MPVLTGIFKLSRRVSANNLVNSGVLAGKVKSLFFNLSAKALSDEEKTG